MRHRENHPFDGPLRFGYNQGFVLVWAENPAELIKKGLKTIKKKDVADESQE